MGSLDSNERRPIKFNECPFLTGSHGKNSEASNGHLVFLKEEKYLTEVYGSLCKELNFELAVNCYKMFLVRLGSCNWGGICKFIGTSIWIFTISKKLSILIGFVNITPHDPLPFLQMLEIPKHS